MARQSPDTPQGRLDASIAVGFRAIAYYVDIYFLMGLTGLGAYLGWRLSLVVIYIYVRRVTSFERCKVRRVLPVAPGGGAQHAWSWRGVRC